MSVNLTCPVCERSPIEADICPNCETDLSTYKILANLSRQILPEKQKRKFVVVIWVPIVLVILCFLFEII